MTEAERWHAVAALLYAALLGLAHRPDVPCWCAKKHDRGKCSTAREAVRTYRAHADKDHER